MSASQYIRDNLVHSWGPDDLDDDEDVSNIDEVSGFHRQVHDENLEIEEEPEGRIIGISKHSHKANNEYREVIKEDFEVNRGDYRADGDGLPDFFFNDDDDVIDVTEDDDE